MAADTPLRWAIVGPGRIAHRFAQAVQGLPQAQLVAVTGRNAERALAFAHCWQSPGPGAVDVAPDLATLLARAAVPGHLRGRALLHRPDRRTVLRDRSGGLQGIQAENSSSTETPVTHAVRPLRQTAHFIICL